MGREKVDDAYLCAGRHVSCRCFGGTVCLAGCTVRLAGLRAVRLARLRSIQRAVAGISGQAALPCRDPAFSWLQSGADKGLLEVVDDVVDVFQPERDADQVRCHSALDLLVVGDLLMRRAPWMNDECLCVANVGEMRALQR